MCVCLFACQLQRVLDIVYSVSTVTCFPSYFFLFYTSNFYWSLSPVLSLLGFPSPHSFTLFCLKPTLSQLLLTHHPPPTSSSICLTPSHPSLPTGSGLINNNTKWLFAICCHYRNIARSTPSALDYLCASTEQGNLQLNQLDIY